jgi:hypothetical protein
MAKEQLKETIIVTADLINSNKSTSTVRFTEGAEVKKVDKKDVTLAKAIVQIMYNSPEGAQVYTPNKKYRITIEEIK